MFALIYVLGDYIYYSKQPTPVEILKSDFPLNIKEKKIFEHLLLGHNSTKDPKKIFFQDFHKIHLILMKGKYY